MRKLSLLLFWLLAIALYQTTKLVVFLDRKFNFKLAFPRSVEELRQSQEWCIRALTDAGALPENIEILKYTLVQPNADLIFRSDTARGKIEYLHQSHRDEFQFVAKFSPSLGSITSRVVYNLQQNHLKEVNFNKEFAPRFKSKLTPQVYFAELHELTANMCILMEYIDNHIEFNEFEGCPEHLLPLVVKNLAEMHATYWSINDKEVKGITAIPRVVADFFESYSWFKWSKPSLMIFRKCWERINVDQTVIHGDPRVGNILFSKADENKMVFIDWQGARMSKAAFDLAYFLILSVPFDIRMKCEDELIKIYHNSLVEAGIEDYSLVEIRDDYNYSSIMLLTMLATAGLTAEGSFDESSDGLMIFVLGYRYWYDRVKSKVDTLHHWTAEKFGMSLEQSKIAIDEILSHYKYFLDELQRSAYPNDADANEKFAEIEKRIAEISSRR